MTRARRIRWACFAALLLEAGAIAYSCARTAPAPDARPALVVAVRPAWGRARPLVLQGSVAARAGVVYLRTVDIDDADLSDLAPLRERFATARVVALGEETHGDGTGFRAKARLVRFLHEALGFDVLAWEAGMYDCERMDEDLRDGTPVRAAMARGLFPLWAESDEVRRLFEWARTRPLAMAGFDPQFSGAGRGEDFGAWVLAALDAVDPSLFDAARRASIDVALRRLPLEAYRALSAGERQQDRALFESLLRAIRDERGRLAERRGEAAAALLERTVANVLRLYAWRDARVDGPSVSSKPEQNNARDEAMADNLLWLARGRFPGRRIIVWTASFHAMRDARGVDASTGRYAALVPMGQRLAEALGDAYVAVALTAYQGEWGRVGEERHRLAPAAPGSLEAELHETGMPYAFVGGEALGPSRPARFLGYTSFDAAWHGVFDAALFTDEMEPAHAAAR